MLRTSALNIKPTSKEIIAGKGLQDTETVLIAGPFGAGKTTFIRTVSGKSITTDRELSGIGVSAGEVKLKGSTTVFADMGVAELDGRKLLLYGAPGQVRFSFTVKGLASRCKYLVFLVDTTDEAAVMRSRLYYERLIKPYFDRFTSKVFALNKRDTSKLPIMRVLELFGSMNCPFVELVALDKGSCLTALRILLGGEGV
ncbi:MAG: hypothetical protein QW760_03855 [Thermofilaceae archaeon]